ncbi:MAG: hypothetical protein V1859_02180 [archaeon]
MNFIELYEELEAKTYEYIKQGYHHNEAKAKAWNELHKKLFQ